MERKYLISVKIIFLLLFFAAGTNLVKADEPVDYFTISGSVKNSKNKKKVEYVNVSAVGTNVGTISNENGEFVLKLDRNLPVYEIELSCIGYYNARISVTKSDLLNQTFLLTPQSFELSEIEIFSWQNPRDLIRAAISKVDSNYVTNPILLTGFYRETVQKGRNYINIAEAVTRIYKTSYSLDIDKDRVQILKGRRLVSPKPSDTLNVKLIAGPNLAVFGDIVKNPDMLLSEEFLQYYNYKMGETTSMNGRLQYVVHFQPEMLTEFPLYYGTFYIDRETLTFTRTEFRFDMRDKKKITDIILRNKPRNLRFSPEEVAYVVTYKEQDGKTYLNYIRNEMRFKCDWKRKLFATNYTVISEMVVTDKTEDNVSRIPAKESFSQHKSLSSEVMTFYDVDFWGAYNIIEPTESLENAVNKLRKQQTKYQ